jgi:ribosomal protein S12 methylthiotransferase
VKQPLGCQRAEDALHSAPDIRPDNEEIGFRLPAARAKLGFAVTDARRATDHVLEKMPVGAGQMQARGYDLVAEPGEADVIVVNTCAFIDRAKKESIDAILEMAQHKEAGRARRLVVTGCLSERYDEELRREIPEIDATLGTGQVADIVRAVEGAATSLADAEPGRPTWIYDHTRPRLLSTPSYMAYVKISEGCDYTCTFCIIPTLRGLHRSRGVEDIVAEVRALADRGVKEIVLVAQRPDTSALSVAGSR